MVAPALPSDSFFPLPTTNLPFVRYSMTMPGDFFRMVGHLILVNFGQFCVSVFIGEREVAENYSHFSRVRSNFGVFFNSRIEDVANFLSMHVNFQILMLSCHCIIIFLYFVILLR